MRLSLLHCPSPSVQILSFSSLYHQFAQNRHRPPPPFTFYLAKRKKDSRMHAEASAVWAKSDTAEVRGNETGISDWMKHTSAVEFGYWNVQFL